MAQQRCLRRHTQTARPATAVLLECPAWAIPLFHIAAHIWNQAPNANTAEILRPMHLQTGFFVPLSNPCVVLRPWLIRPVGATQYPWPLARCVHTRSPEPLRQELGQSRWTEVTFSDTWYTGQTRPQKSAPTASQRTLHGQRQSKDSKESTTYTSWSKQPQHTHPSRFITKRRRCLNHRL